jgi:membrane-associated phospholipid phosphatase
MYGVFNAGAVFYWTVPTAPPWYAATRGRIEDRDALRVRRMMIEYGQQFWGDRWGALYDVLGGNPLAAMPSLHFATSLMAAHLLSEVGPVAGAIGWTYAATLGLALVYLGEHYAVDLLAGGALTLAVRRLGPHATGALRRARDAVAALEALAHEAI